MDERLAQVVTMMRTAPRPGTIVEARARMETMMEMVPRDPDVRRERVSAGGVPADWFRTPRSAEDRVVLYLHGGGYAVGSIETHRDLVGRLAYAADARALAIDYRLAPEHPFPAALDDALAAYRWLLDSGVEARRVVVAGDSAGGGLTLGMLVAARDRGLPLPAGAVCLSPWVDLEGLAATLDSNHDTDYVPRDTLLEFAGMYLAGADPRTPLAAPLHADLAGLPPLLIHAGGAEGLLDDARRIAERARASGVRVTFDVWPDMPHVFHAFAAFVEQGRQAIAQIGEFVVART